MIGRGHIFIPPPSETALGHPSNAALSVLVAPRSSWKALYLLEPVADPEAAPAEDALRAFVQAFDPAAACVPAVTTSTPITVTPFALPFADASVDMVFASLAYRRAAHRHSALWTELHRILSPGGEVLLLARKRDPSRPPVKPYQPSGFARLCQRASNFLQYRFHFLRRSIGRELARTGFEFQEWFVPVRSGDGWLKELKPLPPRRAVWTESAPTSLRNALRYSALLAEELAVRASLRTLSPSVLERCLASAAASLGNADKACRVERLLVTPKEKVVALVVLNGTPAVLRIPLSEHALEATRRNCSALRALEKISHARVAPSLMTEGYSEEHYYAIESKIEGRPLRSLPQGPYGLTLVESLLKTLNPNAAVCTFDDALYENLIGGPLRRLAAAHGGLPAREAIERFFRAALLGKQVSMGMTHGDLSLSNVFVNGDELAGVIDWDDSTPQGMPILDAISHLCSRQFRRTKSFAATFISLASRRWPEAVELSFLDRCYDHLGTDRSPHAALVYLYWLQLLERQLALRFAHQTNVLPDLVGEFSRAILTQSAYS